MKRRNRLLASLPEAELSRIQPQLRTVELEYRQVIHRRNEPIEEIFFLTGGVASITIVTVDGSTVEVATVGDEGVLGIHAFIGGETVDAETILQIPDTPSTSAEVMTAHAFKHALDHREAFHESVQRYSQGLLTLMMQSTACMAFHTTEQRCCRWLLMAHDRVRRDEFQLSHEFLAMMLGTARPTVTLVAGTLQKAGLIFYKHGRVTIVNRQSLESASCECYGSVKRHFERLAL